MKSWLVALAVAVAGAGLVTAPFDAEARRIGGGKAAGMQRQAPPPQPAQTPAQSQATPATPAPTNAPTANAAGTQAAAPVAGTAAAAGAGAAAAKSRSWLGPVAGIAAGLGIAALLSHLGLGEAFANLVTMILLAAVAFFVLRWVMRRLSGAGANAQARSGLAGATAGAGAGTGGTGGLFGQGGSAQPASTDWSRPRGAETSLRSAEPAAGGASAFGAGPASTGPAPGTAAVPADLDTEAFARIAKMIFIRLQAANDAGNLDDLRKFTTPELFASLRLDLQERGGREQRTDVLQLDSEVVDAVEERGESIVSVRFHGLIREESEGVAEPFDEVWHLVRPLDGSREWAIAGITPQTVH